MKALILAAGVGRRLGEAAGGDPKSLLKFGGKSLLQRHIEILQACGVWDIIIVVGHRGEAIEQELDRLGLSGKVALLANPRYREGSVVSLWSARELLRQREPILVMDADVLYDVRAMRRLLSHEIENGFLLDRDVEPGDEPMKLCVRDGLIVDLHKRPSAPYEWYGESIGFTKFTGAAASELADVLDACVREGRTNIEYEEAIRDMIYKTPGLFRFVEITGLPWVEIDFVEDIARARADILPLLADT
jgi:choline kinase